MADNVQQELNTEIEAGSEVHTDPVALGFDATMLVMGGIIGAGIFVNPAEVARQDLLRPDRSMSRAAAR